MKKYLLLFLGGFIVLAGCGAKGLPSVAPDVERINTPRSTDFVYVGPQTDFQLLSGLQAKIVSAKDHYSLINPDKQSPFPEIYSPKGRFLIVTLEAKKVGEITQKTLPPMESIAVVGWDNPLCNDESINRQIEMITGLKRLEPAIVTSEPKKYFLAFVVEGASYGWVINAYRDNPAGDKELYLTVDTGI